MKQQQQGWSRLGAAAIYSWRGLVASWRNEAAFRQEILLAAPMLALAMWLDVDGVERALLLASVIAVLVVELLNTGVEAAIDRIGSERHPLSAMAKDVGSAAVLLSLLATGMVWACILLA